MSLPKYQRFGLFTGLMFTSDHITKFLFTQTSRRYINKWRIYAACLEVRVLTINRLTTAGRVVSHDLTSGSNTAITCNKSRLGYYERRIGYMTKGF